MTVAKDYKIEIMEISEVTVEVTTYQIVPLFYCKVANQDPGATIAKSQSPDRAEARAAALEKATARLNN